MEVEARVTFDKTELDYLIEYLQLILDNPDIVDKKYPNEYGYKVIVHINMLIAQLKREKKKL
jgi:hypothetical protein